MCDRYLNESNDTIVPKKWPMVGWKVTAGNKYGPYRASKAIRGRWVRAKHEDGPDGPHASARGGFHGFCFFPTKEEAKQLAKNHHNRHVERVLVYGRIKRATLNFGPRHCCLAEYIKLERLEASKP